MFSSSRIARLPHMFSSSRIARSFTRYTSALQRHAIVTGIEQELGRSIAKHPKHIALYSSLGLQYNLYVPIFPASHVTRRTDMLACFPVSFKLQSFSVFSPWFTPRTFNNFQIKSFNSDSSPPILNPKNPKKNSNAQSSVQKMADKALGLPSFFWKLALGLPKKEKKEALSFLNAVVKVYCTHTDPDYSLPWQKQTQYTSTGSAFMIGDGKLLTNAHCVEHDTQVKVKRSGDDRKYVAKVLVRGDDCDIALLSVESEDFWKGPEPVRLGDLPQLQDSVTVVGYPKGGNTISVTKGVVSRIEVRSYAHGSTDLLTIQIDAAINSGNSGGPAFNDQGECIGVAFQSIRSAENIGYLIPSTVVSRFLTDYERNGKYTGYPCLGISLQKLDSPVLRDCLKVPKNEEGVLVRKVKPTSNASKVLKKGDVIVSVDDLHVGCEGTVPFRYSERVAYSYHISQKFTGDIVELGIIRAGEHMKVQVVLKPRVQPLVPYHIDGGQPSYIIVGGLVFTTLSKPLIEEDEDAISLKLLTKASDSVAKFRGEQIVILSQVLANEVNIGFENMYNEEVEKLNGIRIKNIHHLAHLIDNCKEKYLTFEFEDNYLAALEREALNSAASLSILKDYGIPSERSTDLLEPYVDDTKAKVDDTKAKVVEQVDDTKAKVVEQGIEKP